MDFVNSLTGGGKDSNNQSQNKDGQSSGGFMDKINGMAGGGEKGEKNEDSLDKGTS
jgi:hypothetical protein